MTLTWMINFSIAEVLIAFWVFDRKVLQLFLIPWSQSLNWSPFLGIIWGVQSAVATQTGWISDLDDFERIIGGREVGLIDFCKTRKGGSPSKSLLSKHTLSCLQIKGISRSGGGFYQICKSLPTNTTLLVTTNPWCNPFVPCYLGPTKSVTVWLQKETSGFAFCQKTILQESASC